LSLSKRASVVELVETPGSRRARSPGSKPASVVELVDTPWISTGSIAGLETWLGGWACRNPLDLDGLDYRARSPVRNCAVVPNVVE